MELGVMENHVAVIALHNCGKSDSQTFRLLKPLKISRMFVSRAINRFRELWRYGIYLANRKVKVYQHLFFSF
jgi:hypothetical protein